MPSDQQQPSKQDTITTAFAVAAQVAQGAAVATFRAVFSAALSGGQWRGTRWLCSPAQDGQGKALVQQVPINAMVLSLDDLPQAISQPSTLATHHQLRALADACHKRLIDRATDHTEATSAASSKR